MGRLIVALLFFATALSAQALDGVSLVYGRGNNVDIFGLELRSEDWRRWALGERWQLSAYGIGSIAYWRAREDTIHKELWDAGVAPVLRLQRAGAGGAAPYLEASIGVHLLSERKINGNREMSTAFQFGEFVGAGVLLGKRQQLGLGVRLHHVSNGGIENPNPGLTYAAVALHYRF